MDISLSEIIASIIGSALPGSLLGALIGIAIAKKQNKGASLKYGQLIKCLFIAWASGIVGIVLGGFVTHAVTGASQLLGDNAIFYSIFGGVVGAWFLYTRFARVNRTDNMH